MSRSLILRTLNGLQDADGIVGTPAGVGIPLGHGTFDHGGVPVTYRAWRDLDPAEPRAYMEFSLEPTDRYAQLARDLCAGWPADTVHVATWASNTDDTIIFEHLIFP